ncbi:hypothetical protein I547_5065 [Mycobacterium kansasii 824]|uniref:Uncharacterized protein n=1 Tax=Mycobacterium kansasii TaxID=1768 RepID=A0A1V3WDK9_MYCKA|nr:hypothetical protein I547_5065 [Mycobacterium kansasii 824]OOK65064.1 hypothetical protein BZL30_8877 [Mycobacterium kansasii]
MTALLGVNVLIAWGWRNHRRKDGLRRPSPRSVLFAFRAIAG